MTTLRFIAAVIVAVTYSVLKWSAPWERAKGAYNLWWNYRHTAPASESQRIDRLMDCGKCKIFYRPLMTCGSPLQKDKRGCFCQMQIKAKVAAATCWAHDKKDESLPGWRVGV